MRRQTLSSTPWLRPVLATLATVAALTLGIQAQQPAAPAGQQPTFRSGVDVVQVDVVVVDKDGRPVTDLAADDFEILEEGTPQTVATMSLVDIPITTRAGAQPGDGAPEPDVLSNAAAGERRLYTIVLGGYSANHGMKVRHFLRRFVEERFQDGDIGAILSIGQGLSRNTQPFTGSRRLLLSAVDGVALSGDIGTRPLTAFGDILESIARVDARRKAVLLVSSSFTDTFDIVDNVGGVRSIDEDAFREAMGIATRGNVAIYTIDPAGLTVGVGDSEGGLSAESALSPEGDWAARGLALERRQSLRSISWLTGGFGLTNSNNFDAAFERIVQEASTYYCLGYYPTDRRQDGRFRRVTVRVKRPGLEVRSRIGYVAERPARTRPARRVVTNAASPVLRRAVDSPVTANGLPLRVTAVPFRGTKDQAIVALAIQVDVTRLGLVEEGGKFVGELEIGHLATNEQNRVVPGEFHVARLELTRDSHQQALRRGVLVLTETRLRPGRYQIRVGASNRTDVSGSVVYDIEVPDFSDGRLAMSGVIVTDERTDNPLMLRHKEPLGGIAPGTPTTVREFTTADTITTFVALYDNDRRASHTLTTTSQLRTLNGRDVRTVSDHVASADLQDAAHHVTATFPLQGLAAGDYVIDIESRSSASPDTAVRRAVPIRIR